MFLNHIGFKSYCTKAVDLGCEIINLSLGSEDFSQALAEVVEYARNQGVLLVAATGNEGTNEICYPAALPGVIGVGAVSDENERAYYSQFGTHVDIVAPGCCVGSTDIDGSFVPTTVTGTSFAAPLVTGILALGMAAEPTLLPQHFVTALLSTAGDLGSEGWDPEYGYGLADAVSFLEALPTARTMTQIKTKTDFPQIMEIAGGIAIYTDTPWTDALLAGVSYTTENELIYTKLLTFSVPKGYSVFDIILPENSKVFLFKDLRPLTKPLVK